MKERHRHTAGYPRIQRNWRYWHTRHFKIQQNRRCTAYMILFKIRIKRYNNGIQFETQRKAATPGYTTLLESESNATTPAHNLKPNGSQRQSDTQHF